MAEETESFPSLPARQWWALRERFKRSMPSVITANYLESTLGTNANTARDILTQLRYLRLLDVEGRVTEIAEDWRHDDTYAKACNAIRQAVYPEELLHASPQPWEDRSSAERWFARRKKVGQNAALKMAITYALVSEADLSKAPDASTTATRQKVGEQGRGRGKAAKTAAAGVAKADMGAQTADAHQSQRGGQGASLAPSVSPSLHIDVQIHIAADASPAQIDQIFASMARHLYQQKVDSDGERS
jgi:hypothetical protein